MTNSIAVLLEGRSTSVQSVAATLTVADAVKVMNQEKISSVLITEGGRLAGIFTERDVLRRVVGENLDPKTTPLSRVMTTGVKTITPGTSIKEAMAIFVDQQCRHLPVVAEGKLSGIVSLGDVSRWLTKMDRAEADHLKNYISGGFAQ